MWRAIVGQTKETFRKVACPEHAKTYFKATFSPERDFKPCADGPTPEDRLLKTSKKHDLQKKHKKVGSEDLSSTPQTHQISRSPVKIHLQGPKPKPSKRQIYMT